MRVDPFARKCLMSDTVVVNCVQYKQGFKKLSACARAVRKSTFVLECKYPSMHTCKPDLIMQKIDMLGK